MAFIIELTYFYDTTEHRLDILVVRADVIFQYSEPKNRNFYLPDIVSFKTTSQNKYFSL